MKGILPLIFLILALISCNQSSPPSSSPVGELYAWCIVPFDSKERSPEERIAMLTRLGIDQYAYDWREKHLPEMATEWALAEAQGIEVMSVWMWFDQRQDSVGHLSSANEKVWETLKETQLKTHLWVSFNSNFFEGLAHEEAVKKGVEMISYICQRADSLGLKIGLYNHGDWFGEPQNQIEIIKALPNCDLGLIYSFHHAHHQLDYYEELVDTMLPYLWAVNLNGMRKDGPQILPIGAGDREKGMITYLLEKGYSGPFGVLGHVEERDVEVVLKENLEGLSSLGL